MANALHDKKFKSDVVFNYINKNFVTLKDEDMRKNNVHLKRVIHSLIEIMKSEDRLFSATYRRIAYAGSYYDGLKVGKPEEFDLDIVINLPINYKEALTFHPDESRPGYIKIKLKPEKMKELRQTPRWSTDYKSLDNWVNTQNFIYQDIFSRWIEGVIDKALNTLRGPSGKYTMELEGCKYTISKKKSGPAKTLYILVPEGYQIDVDLVPVLEFELATPKGFRTTNGYEKKSWLAVAKPLEGKDANILWRLSFYDQERELIKGPVKPVIRQMKKLRDTQNFNNLASYYIKTLFLWELESHKNDPEFLKMSNTCLFVHMLRKLCEASKKGGRGICDFWCEKQNLLSKLSPMEKENMYNRLTKIIQSIDERITEDQCIIAKYILTGNELTQMKEDAQFISRISTNGANSSGNSVTLQHSLSTQSLPAKLPATLSSFHLSKKELPQRNSTITQSVPATPSNVKTPGIAEIGISFLNVLSNGVPQIKNNVSTQAVPATPNSKGNAMLDILHLSNKGVAHKRNNMDIQAFPLTSTNVNTTGPDEKAILGLLHSLKNDVTQIKSFMSTQSVRATPSNVNTPGPNENTMIDLVHSLKNDMAQMKSTMSTQSVRATSSNVSTPDPNENAMLGLLHSLKNDVAQVKSIMSIQSIRATPSYVNTPSPTETAILSVLQSLKSEIAQIKDSTRMLPARLSNVQTADTNEDVLSLLNSLKNDVAQTKDNVTELNVKMTRMEIDAKRMNLMVTQLCREVADMKSVTQDLREQSKLGQPESRTVFPHHDIVQNRMMFN